jgi:histidinol-phosphatase
MIEAGVAIWDIAALSLIVEEAGGKLTDLSGEPITLHTTDALATNKKIHNDCLKYFI